MTAWRPQNGRAALEVVLVGLPFRVSHRPACPESPEAFADRCHGHRRLCAILCGADGPTAIHRWAVSRFDWLNQFLSLPSGTPSRDCIRRVLMAINPGDFQRCFEAWIRSTVIPLLDGTVQQVAIDGKTLRRAHNSRQDLDPLHVVSAWATELGLSLGQVATGDKPDEISGIQAVLKVLDLPHSLITLDALGCQKEIVNAIVEGGGRYVIAIKANQPKLFS
ncbi:MAG: ISAs1 family transposase, partial [Planctomycetaceae bacterium]